MIRGAQCAFTIWFDDLMEKFIGVHFLLQRAQRFCGLHQFCCKNSAGSVSPRFEPTAVDRQRGWRLKVSSHDPSVMSVSTRSVADRKLWRKTEPSRMRQPPNGPDTVSHLASVRHTTVSMTNPADRVEIITSVQRRRRWTASEKVRIVEETFEPGMTVSLVARRHGVAPNQLFTWRRLVAQGALTAAGSGEEVVPASDHRALQSQVRELQRLLGKKTLEAEILKEALEHATGSKKRLRLPPLPLKDGSR